MNILLKAAILSMIPIAELRGGIPLAYFSGVGLVKAFAVCVLANTIAIPITFFFMDYIHDHLAKIKIYKRFFDKHLDKSRKKFEKNARTKWAFLALAMFVGVPLPVTGAYTGTLLAWFFKMERKKAYLSILAGIIMAGVIVSLVVLSSSAFWKFLIK